MPDLHETLWHHWCLLWPLGHVERVKRYLQIAADLEFEWQLEAVRTAMGE